MKGSLGGVNLLEQGLECPGAVLAPLADQRNVSFEPLEILLVEDNPGDARMLIEGLKSAVPAARLSLAIDGEEALGFLKQIGRFADAPRPDLILLDLRLPRKSGFEVLVEIKQDPVLATIPVVVQTCSALDADIQKAYRLHANSYIIKPSCIEELDQAIRALVDFWIVVARLPQGEEWKTV